MTDIRSHLSQLTQQLQTETDSRAVEQRKMEVLLKEVETEKDKVASLLAVVDRNKEVITKTIHSICDQYILKYYICEQIINHLNEMITSLQMGAGVVHSPSGPVSRFAQSSTPSNEFQFSSYKVSSAESHSDAALGLNQNIDISSTVEAKFGYPVVSANYSSPDGFQQFYNEKSPPLFSSGYGTKKPLKSEVDSIYSMSKSDNLLISRGSNIGNGITPGKTISPVGKLEQEGYYRGLPLGSSGPTPAEGVFSRTGLLSDSTFSGNKGNIKPRYHWQLDDFGVEDATA